MSEHISVISRERSIFTFFSPSFILCTDCCISVTEGDENFRGQYTFNFTLVSTTRHFTCVYGRMDDTETPVTRKCMASGSPDSIPVWQKLNITACKPDTVTSQKLVILQVNILGKEKKRKDCCIYSL